MGHRFFERDRAGFVEIQQRIVEVLHTFLATFLDGFFNFGDVAFQNQVLNVWRIEHQLDRRNALACAGTHQTLRNNAAQVVA